MKYPITVAEYAEVRDAAGVLVALCFSRDIAKLVADSLNLEESMRCRVDAVPGTGAVTVSGMVWGEVRGEKGGEHE